MSQLWSRVLVFLGVVLVGAFLSDDNDMVVSEAVQKIKEEGITSEFFREFVKRVYDTSYNKVSEEDLAEITYLHIFIENDCDVVEYVRNDGGIEQIEMPDTSGRQKLQSLSISGANNIRFLSDLPGLKCICREIS